MESLAVANTMLEEEGDYSEGSYVSLLFKYFKTFSFLSVSLRRFFINFTNLKFEQKIYPVKS